MKKKILAAILTIALSAVYSTTFAKISTGSDLAESIRLYKAGNYAQCYVKLDDAIKRDPSNPLCYYYKAMTAAQIGKREEAISNYERTLELAPQKSVLIKYAAKGKRCLETPDKCDESYFANETDKFINGTVPLGFSDEVRGMFERLKIEQMMRDMNRNNDIDPQRFKEYKDFSSMNNTPGNDEIVAAIKTLKDAGLLNFGSNTYSELSLLTGNNPDTYNLMNMAKTNPQMIQTMLTSGMTLGF